MSIIKYTTGPVENAIGLVIVPGESRSFFAKALNNGKKSATVTIRLYRLNGKKTLVATRSFRLAPGASNFRILNVANLLQYEVQYTVSCKHVVVSGWGKNKNGRLVAAHRFTQSELVRQSR